MNKYYFPQITAAKPYGNHSKRIVKLPTRSRILTFFANAKMSFGVLFQAKQNAAVFGACVLTRLEVETNPNSDMSSNVHTRCSALLADAAPHSFCVYCQYEQTFLTQSPLLRRVVMDRAWYSRCSTPPAAVPHARLTTVVSRRASEASALHQDPTPTVVIVIANILNQKKAMAKIHDYPRHCLR